MRKKISCIPFIIGIMITVIVTYLVNCAIPFMMDDIWYSTKLSGDELISSWKDIIEAQRWHYMNWGGRSICHTILQFILLGGESFADWLNIIAMLVLSMMVCLIAREKMLWAVWATLGMIHGLNANWKMSMYWESGAANYLYISIIVLLFLYCYLPYLEMDKVVNKQWWCYVIIIPLGLCAGWSNENIGPTVFLISLFTIFFLYYKRRIILPWMILGNLSSLIGSILMIIAPGNTVRSLEVTTGNVGVLWKIFLRCYAESKAFVEYLFPTILLLLCLITIYSGIMRKKLSMTNKMLLMGAVISWGAMILSPHYPDRATFGTMVFLICVILSLASEIMKENTITKRMIYFLFTLVWLRGMFFLGEFLGISWGWIS